MRLLVPLLWSLWLPSAAAGHDVDVTSVARVFLEEVSPNRYRLSVVDAKVPLLRGAPGTLPPNCGPVRGDGPGARAARSLVFECASPLTLDDVLVLPWSLEGVVVLGRWANGVRASGYFEGDGTAVHVRLGDLRAGSGSAFGLASRYARLGVEHILSGFDHLLFVVGLLLLVQGFWALVRTITAFTIAHSLTLGVVVMGWVPIAGGAVEAAIALSIVLLAREIIVGRRGRRHLVHRRPWLVAFVFGLLHGFGFAGALREIGLPGEDIPLALLFFNLGVEGGQLAFVAAIVGVAEMARRANVSAPRGLAPGVGYAMGALATLWLIDRLPGLWGA